MANQTDAQRSNAFYLIAGILLVVSMLETLLGFAAGAFKVDSIDFLHLVSLLAVAIGVFLRNRSVTGAGAALYAVAELWLIVRFINYVNEGIVFGWMTWASRVLCLALFLLLAIACFIPRQESRKGLLVACIDISAVLVLFAIYFLFEGFGEWPLSYLTWFNTALKLYYIASYFLGWTLSAGVLFLSLAMMKEGAASPGAPEVSASAPRASALSADDLVKHYDLMQAGVITQEEFEEQKRKLVD